jgi:hypothetical protein
MEPLALPQVELVGTAVTVTAEGCVTVAEAVFAQPFASVTVTV